MTHRRGTPQPAASPLWQGWVRYPCTDPDCDWAVYTDPKHNEYSGYIPSAERPGNTFDPDDLPANRAVTTTRRLHQRHHDPQRCAEADRYFGTTSPCLAEPAEDPDQGL